MHYNKDRVEISFVKNGYGRKTRYFKLNNLSDLLIINDASILEMYFNGGEFTFTTRCFSDENGLKIIEGNLDIEISELEEYTYEETFSNR